VELLVIFVVGVRGRDRHGFFAKQATMGPPIFFLFGRTINLRSSGRRFERLLFFFCVPDWGMLKCQKHVNRRGKSWPIINYFFNGAAVARDKSA
jgi:hypothetical protein